MNRIDHGLDECKKKGSDLWPLPCVGLTDGEWWWISSSSGMQMKQSSI